MLSSMRVLVSGLLFTATAAFAANQCPSVYLDSNDLGGYPPIGGRVSLPSAFDGTQKLIPVRTRDRNQTCDAVVQCVAPSWDYEGLNCDQRTRQCDSVIWTVYDLGGWAPNGGQVTLPQGRDGTTTTFGASASDGRRCTISARCVGAQWQPDFSACP